MSEAFPRVDDADYCPSCGCAMSGAFCRFCDEADDEIDDYDSDDPDEADPTMPGWMA